MRVVEGGSNYDNTVLYVFFILWGIATFIFGFVIIPVCAWVRRLRQQPSAALQTTTRRVGWSLSCIYLMFFMGVLIMFEGLLFGVVAFIFIILSLPLVAIAYNVWLYMLWNEMRLNNIGSLWVRNGYLLLAITGTLIH